METQPVSAGAKKSPQQVTLSRVLKAKWFTWQRRRNTSQGVRYNENMELELAELDSKPRFSKEVTLIWNLKDISYLDIWRCQRDRHPRLRNQQNQKKWEWVIQFRIYGGKWGKGRLKSDLLTLGPISHPILSIPLWKCNASGQSSELRSYLSFHLCCHSLVHSGSHPLFASPLNWSPCLWLLPLPIHYPHLC